MTTAKRALRTQQKQKRTRAESQTRRRVASQAHGSSTPGFGRVAATPMQVSMVPRSVKAVHAFSAFPAHKKCTLRYCDKLQVLTNSAAVGSWVFRINSMFDPDLTGTGHQPRYYDQLCTATGPYQVYRVMGVRVTVECASDPSHNAEPVIFAAGFTNQAALPTLAAGSAVPNPYSLAELPGWTALIQDSNSGSKKMNFQRTIADILGTTDKAVIAEDGYAAAYNANPAELAYFQIVAMNCGDTGGVSDGEVGVSIEFDCQFEEPAAILPS